MDSKSIARKSLRVQVPPPAQNETSARESDGERRAEGAGKGQKTTSRSDEMKGRQYEKVIETVQV